MKPKYSIEQEVVAITNTYDLTDLKRTRIKNISIYKSGKRVIVAYELEGIDIYNYLIEEKYIFESQEKANVYINKRKKTKIRATLRRAEKRLAEHEKKLEALQKELAEYEVKI